MFWKWKRVRFLAVCGLLAACGQSGQSGSKGPVPVGVTQTGGSAEAPADAPRYDATKNATLDDILAQNKSVETDLHLVTRIRFAKSVFEFYEPTAGTIVLSEAGLAGAPTHQSLSFDTSLRYVDLYKLLAPSTPVPQELVDAQARFDRALSAKAPFHTQTSPAQVTHRKGLESTSTVSSADEIGCEVPPPNNGACDPSWFKTNLCSDGNIDPYIRSNDIGKWPWCNLNWWNGLSTTSGSNYSVGYGASCASIGAHTLSESADYGGGGAWSVAQGTYRSRFTVQHCGNVFWDWCNDQHMAFNIGGSGVEYQHCGIFEDYD